MTQRRTSDPEHLVENLVHTYGLDLVRFLARRVRSVVDARDLAQETYVRLLRLERKDLIRDPRSYLYRIAANILYEFELGRKSDTAGLMRWSAKLEAESEWRCADHDADNLMLSRRIESALIGLSPKCRAVVLLHRREGMTYNEIGQELNLSTSMVKKYLAQGLKHCRAYLEDLV